MCLQKKQNETSVLAEKALHQMVVCGYALIGHDPAQAVHSVLALKNMIRTGIKPVRQFQILCRINLDLDYKDKDNV